MSEQVTGEESNNESKKTVKDHLANITSVLDKPGDKWSFLYFYARKSLDEEIDRFQRIDDKSVKLLSSVSIIITIFLALFKWVVEDSNVEFTIYVYIVSILVFSSLCFAWHFFFKSLKLKLAPRMPLDEGIFKLVQEKNMATIHVALYKSCQNAVNDSFKTIEEKAAKLKHGYTSTSIAGFLLVIFVLMVSYETVQSKIKTQNIQKENVQKENVQKENVQKENVLMPTEQQNSQNPTNDPDLDITAPEHQLVTNDDKTPIETKDTESKGS